MTEPPAKPEPGAEFGGFETTVPLSPTGEPSSPSPSPEPEPEPEPAGQASTQTGATTPPVCDPPPPPVAPPPGGGQHGWSEPGSGPFAARYGLVRPINGRYFAGVCAAIGRATSTD